MKILLMGNPNVGKSVLFSRLTGVKVICANYPGTTVNYTCGFMKLGDERVEVIDVPGTYTLEPTSDAERIALQMLETGDMAINVVDATNLERNLYLTLQLLERKIPVIIALNLWDDALHHGIKIDLEKLSAILGTPVIPTVAVTGQGIKEMVENLPKASSPQMPVRTRDERWAAVGDIVSRVQTITHRHHTWLERMQDASVRPVSGAVIAAAVVACSFIIIRLLGEGLINYVIDPIFKVLWTPVVLKISELLGGSGLLHMIIVGKIAGGQIDFIQAFGVLTSGLYVSLGMVLPYVFSFYLVIGVLEDIGYLPRLGVLMDTVMHRLGMHGYAIIPTLLGLGCKVPAIMATRILESKRERLIAATLIAIAVPCASLQAMIFGLVGARGWQYVAMVFLTLFVVWIVLGTILRRLLKGFSPELLIEIPPYRVPQWQALLKKIQIRITGYLKEAMPIVLGAVVVINVLYAFGVFQAIANFTAPLVTGILGLPKEAVTSIVIGMLRKDVALGMMAPLNLTSNQLVIGSVVLSMFFPCIATFVVLFRELGWFNSLKSIGIMLAAVAVTGGVLNLILP